MDKTDYHAAWRGNDLDPSKYTGQAHALAVNFVAIKAKLGIDVALTYLCSANVTDASGPVTAMAKAITGAEGGAVVSIYTVGQEGESGVKDGLGIGRDWTMPFIGVRDGLHLDVGQPHRNDRQQTNGIVVAETMDLPALDTTKRARRKVFTA